MWRKNLLVDVNGLQSKGFYWIKASTTPTPFFLKRRLHNPFSFLRKINMAKKDARRSFVLFFLSNEHFLYV